MRVQISRCAFGVLFALLVACDSPMTTPGSTRGGSTTDMKRNDAAALRVESLSEAEVIEEIVRQVPAERRAKVRAELLDTSKVLQSDKPTFGPLFARLAEIRWAKAGPEREALAAKASADAARRDRLVRVSVALSPDLEEGVRAVVIRRPGDGGKPLLLLRERDVTSLDLQIGLLAAAKAIAEHGPNPSRALRRSVRGALSGQGAPPQLEKYIELLRASERRPLEGLGTLRSIDVLTDRYEAGTRK